MNYERMKVDQSIHRLRMARQADMKKYAALEEEYYALKHQYELLDRNFRIISRHKLSELCQKIDELQHLAARPR